MAQVEVLLLSAETSTRQKNQLNRILTEARRELVVASAHLESIDERIYESEADAQRLLLWARANSLALAIIDVQLQSPHPAEMTIRQLAVHRDVRGRGIGSRLVRVAQKYARSRGNGLFHMHAHVIDSDGQAAQFWQSQGFKLNSRGQFTKSFDPKTRG